MKNMLQHYQGLSRAKQLVLLGWFGIMLLLPFHAFLSTWGGTSIGPYALWKVWKELLLIVLLIPTAVLIYKNKALRRDLFTSPLFFIATAYATLHFLSILFADKDTDALLYGLAINLRIIGFFFVSYTLFYCLRLPKKVIVRTVLASCLVVVTLGLLQLLILPSDILSHFGYEKGVTIAPINTVDEQPDQIRLTSTLRGPNPLGAYLVLPGVMLIYGAYYLFQKREKISKRMKARAVFGIGVSIVGILIVLYGSQARAAWIAFVLSSAIVVLLLLAPKWRLYAIGAGIALACIAGFVGYQARNTSFVQNAILHNNPETGGEVTSNDAHIAAAKEGFGDVASRPITGCGPGCAGPASFYHKNGPRLAENYYIQIAQEVGVFGVVLFLAFVSLVGRRLFVLRQQPLALLLFASLVGLSCANLLLHVWADDTLAYVWWGAAGAFLGAEATAPADPQKAV